MHARRVPQLLAVAISVSFCSTPAGEAPGPGGDDGRIIWKVPTPASSTRDPALSDGIVYFAGPAEHSVVAIRGATGQVLWKAIAPGPPFPLAGVNVVATAQTVAMGDVAIYGFDKANGARRWIFAEPEDDEPGRHRLAANASTIFAASRLGRVHALDAMTGRPRWTVDLAHGDTLISAFDPAIAGNELYVGTKRFDVHARGSLYALDATTGALRWKYDFTPEFPNLFAGCLGNALVIGDMVVVAQEDGRLFAFARANGQVRWIAPAVLLGGAGRGNDIRYLAPAGTDILATSLNGTIVLLEGSTGAQKWRTGKIVASVIDPLSTDGVVAYVSHGGVFAAYSVSTGAILWTDPAVPGTEPSKFAGEPVLSGDRIFVAGGDAFYAIRK